MKGINQSALGFISKKEVASLYGISTRTLSNWIARSYLTKKLDRVFYSSTQHLFSLRQILIIFEVLDYPEKYEFIQQGKIKYFPINTYSKKEIASFYGISGRTLNYYISLLPNITPTGDFISFEAGKLFYPKQVFYIFKYLGHPFYYTEKPDDYLPPTENEIRKELLIEETYGMSIEEYLKRREQELTRNITNQVLNSWTKAIDKTRNRKI